MSPEEYCKKACEAGVPTLTSALGFLNPSVRHAIEAVYALNRELDDVVEILGVFPASAHQKLNEWREEISALYQGKPVHLVTQALLPHINTYHLNQKDFLTLIDGKETALDKKQFAHFEALKAYCTQVAGSLSILGAYIFGATHPKTREYAKTLGIALELTRIIRDLGEDIQRGYLYLPADEMARFQLEAKTLESQQLMPSFLSLMDVQYQRAKAYFKKAHALLPDEDRATQKPSLVIAAVCEGLLDEMNNRAFPVFGEKFSLSPAKKMMLALHAYSENA